jgi:hypothetical protein
VDSQSRERTRRRRALLRLKNVHLDGQKTALVWAFPPNVWPHQQTQFVQVVSADEAETFIEGQEYTITLSQGMQLG